MNTSELKTRDLIEQILGCTLVAGGLYKLLKNSYGFSILLSNYRKYTKMDLKKKHRISNLIANPSLNELTFLDIFCNANKETFKNHFKEFNQNNNPKSTYSYFHTCNSFEASSIEDGKKHKIICKPQYMNSIYMTSSLLQNMKVMEKGSTNKPFTALAYGQLQYSPEHKHLLFLIQSLTTSKEETDQIWHIGLTIKSSVIFSIIGLVLGVGFSLVQHHKDHFEEYFRKVKHGFVQQKPVK